MTIGAKKFERLGVLCVAAWAVFGALVPNVRAQCSLCPLPAYEASQGSPLGLCWDVVSTRSFLETTETGALRLTSIAQGGGILFSATNVAPFTFPDGAAFEARVRVTAGGSAFAGDYGASTFIRGVDDGRWVVGLWIEPTRVVLKTDPTLNLGPGTAIYEMDTASEFHTYRVETDPNGGGSKLFVDGILRLSVLHGNTSLTLRPLTFEWGNDARRAWNAVSEWEYVKLEQCDCIDFNNDGLFPDDADLLEFLTVLAGGTCSPGNTCNDIDFNNDGLFPDDADLLAFLTVLAGGNC